MPSIYSDEMRENILADFSSKNPKVSASIIERFGENPRSKGIGALEAEQYRAAVDAPLYANSGTTGGIGQWFSDSWNDYLSGFKDPKGKIDWEDKSGQFAGLLKLLSVLGTKKKPQRSPTSGTGYRAPKLSQMKGAGKIGYATGGVPSRYQFGGDLGEEGGGSLLGQLGSSMGGGLQGILQLLGPFLNELLINKYIDKDEEAAPVEPIQFPSTTVLGSGRADGGTVLNRKLFLGGGEVDGIGGERDDLVPIWASDKEYVVSANGVRRMGGGNHARGIAALDEINNNGRLV